MPRYVVTLRCADRPGIVQAASTAIVEVEGNIAESAQYSDPITGAFCMRTGFDTAETDLAAISGALAQRLAPFDPVLTIRLEARRRRVLILVSRLDHCLLDLLYRRQSGELPADVPMVVSNHPDCAPVAERYGVPFRHLPVTTDTRADAEDELARIVDEHGVEVIVLARYMQILSDGFCGRYAGRIINIHHSFLPGFKGARPYHQAYERGVKLVGATAHYVTADLDEGPIIEQDVVRAGHGRSPAELAAVGRDVERTVLARALRLHLEDRVMLVGRRTIVFDG